MRLRPVVITQLVRGKAGLCLCRGHSPRCPHWNPEEVSGEIARESLQAVRESGWALAGW